MFQSEYPDMKWDRGLVVKKIPLVSLVLSEWALTKVSVVFDLQLYKSIGNGSMDGNLHGNITVLAQAPILLQ